MKRKICPRLSPFNSGMSPFSPLSHLGMSLLSPLSSSKKVFHILADSILLLAMLIFIPISSLISCTQTSVDELLNEYNQAYDSDFGKGPKTVESQELIPFDSYEIDYPNELLVTAKRGYKSYLWTLKDSSGKMYSCDTGMYVVYINTSLLGLAAGDYTLYVTALDSNKNKYVDSAIVIVKYN